jgi:2-methylcitrate dehydratase
VQVFFKDGSKTDKVSIDYPIGHRRRRAEGIPVLLDKFRNALVGYLPQTQVVEIVNVCEQSDRMLDVPVPAFLDLFATS